MSILSNRHPKIGYRGQGKVNRYWLDERRAAAQSLFCGDSGRPVQLMSCRGVEQRLASLSCVTIPEILYKYGSSYVGVESMYSALILTTA